MMDGHGMKMIDCMEAERRLQRFLDRELSEIEIAEVQGHLDMCDNCRARFRFEAGLNRLVKRAAQDEAAPSELRERIRALGHRSSRPG